MDSMRWLPSVLEISTRFQAVSNYDYSKDIKLFDIEGVCMYAAPILGKVCILTIVVDGMIFHHEQYELSKLAHNIRKTLDGMRDT